MAIKLLSRKTAIAGLVMVAGLGGGVAYAYPSGTAMTVSATATTSGTSAPVTVTVANGNPACQIRVNVDGGPDIVLPAGTSTTTVTIPAVAGSHSVRARTVDCPKGAKEHAKSKFVILNAQASHAATAQVKKNYEVTYSGLQPDDILTVTATLSGSSPLQQLVDSDSVDKRGNAKVKFKFKSAGTWSISSSASPSGATVAPFSVSVS
jgi:hypothetical protein